MSTSINGKCVFGDYFSNNRPSEQINDLNRVISEETLKKTYPMTISITANLDGSDVSTSQESRYHYCQDLHFETTQSAYTQFKTDIDTENEDVRVFYIED